MQIIFSKISQMDVVLSESKLFHGEKSLKIKSGKKACIVKNIVWMEHTISGQPILVALNIIMQETIIESY